MSDAAAMEALEDTKDMEAITSPAQPSTATKLAAPVPLAAQDFGTVTIEIVAPANVKPDQPIGCRLPDGMLHMAVIPDGALPGSKVQFVLRMTSNGPVDVSKEANAPTSEIPMAQTAQPATAITPGFEMNKARLPATYATYASHDSLSSMPALTISNNGTLARVAPAVPVAAMEAPFRFPLVPPLLAAQRLALLEQRVIREAAAVEGPKAPDVQITNVLHEKRTLYAADLAWYEKECAPMVHNIAPSTRKVSGVGLQAATAAVQAAAAVRAAAQDNLRLPTQELAPGKRKVGHRSPERVAEEQARNPVAAAPGSCKTPRATAAVHVAEAPPVRLSLTATSLGGGTVIATVKPTQRLVHPTRAGRHVLWTAEMDAQLRAAVMQLGEERWSLIAEHVPGRAGKSCRDRWLGHLSPQVNKSAWTAEEEKLIVDSVAELGTRWSEIAKRFVGRTDNAIKNRYNSEVRKRERSEQRAKREAATAEEQTRSGLQRAVAKAKAAAAPAIPLVRLSLMATGGSSVTAKVQPQPQPQAWSLAKVDERLGADCSARGWRVQKRYCSASGRLVYTSPQGERFYSHTSARKQHPELKSPTSKAEPQVKAVLGRLITGAERLHSEDRKNKTRAKEPHSRASMWFPGTVKVGADGQSSWQVEQHLGNSRSVWQLIGDCEVDSTAVRSCGRHEAPRIELGKRPRDEMVTDAPAPKRARAMVKAALTVGGDGTVALQLRCIDASRACTASPLQEEAEGLQLQLSSKSLTGYTGVSLNPALTEKPFIARYWNKKKRLKELIGYFDTAVEGAVAYARYVEQRKKTAQMEARRRERVQLEQDPDSETSQCKAADRCWRSPLCCKGYAHPGACNVATQPAADALAGARDNEKEDDSAWVQCDECQKWRELSLTQAAGLADGDSWTCALNSNPKYNRCEVSEDPLAWEVDDGEGSGEESEEEEVVMIDEDEVCDGATEVYIRPPRGRVPVGKEWDTSTGEWVPAGQSKGATWVKRREVGHCRPKPGHELGGKRGGLVVLDQRQKRTRCSETEDDEDMVMVDEDENNEAKEEVVEIDDEDEPAAKAVPALRQGLPPGWCKVVDSSRPRGVRGPAGERAQTRKKAGEMYLNEPAPEGQQEAAIEMIELDETQVAVEGESDAESEDEPPAPLAAAAEPMAAEDANALVGRRIRVWWEGDCKWFRGRIQAYNALWQTHIVLYDDNDRRSYRMNEVRWELEGTAGVEVMEEWEALELRCAISFLPLTDPAKGSSCAHVSRCNFDMLWQHVSRHHACPMAGCEAPMRRTRDVVRDDALRAKLDALPDGTQTIWRRGDEIRSTQPEPAHASVAQLQPQPQPQRRPARSGTSASTAPVPSSTAGCKERVVVVKKERR